MARTPTDLSIRQLLNWSFRVVILASYVAGKRHMVPQILRIVAARLMPAARNGVFSHNRLACQLDLLRALTVASDGGSRGEGIYLASLGCLKTHSLDAAALLGARDGARFELLGILRVHFAILG